MLGEKREKALKWLSHTLKSMQDKDHLEIIYPGNKPQNYFQIKGKAEVKHEHDLVYKATCLEKTTCNATYIGETARRFTELVKDHRSSLL